MFSNALQEGEEHDEFCSVSCIQGRDDKQQAPPWMPNSKRYGRKFAHNCSGPVSLYEPV